MQQMLAFTTDHVASLTGLSVRQIRYWDRTGFFEPTLLDDYRSRAFERIYSFRDVVGLRTIGILRNRYRIPLQELRRVGEWLHREYQTPWASLRFALAGRRVVFFDPGTALPTEPRGVGQTLVPVSLEPIAVEAHREVERLKERRPEQYGQLSRNRYIVHNAWVVAGTRIPTQAVWRFHKAGYSAEAILREYPSLTRADVEAAIEAEAKRRKVA